MLGFYGLHDWQIIQVDDRNPSSTLTGQLTDYSNVEKFELTEEEYAKRTGMPISISRDAP